MPQKPPDVSPSARTIRIDCDDLPPFEKDGASSPADPEALKTFFVEVSAGSEAATEADPGSVSKLLSRSDLLVTQPTQQEELNELSRAEPSEILQDPSKSAVDLLETHPPSNTGFRHRRARKRKQKRSRYFSLSLFTHLAALVLLSTYTMRLPPRPESLELSAVPAVFEEELLEHDLEIEPIDEEELTAGLESETVEDPLATEISLESELDLESDYARTSNQSQNFDGLMEGTQGGGGLGLEGLGLDAIDNEAERVEIPAEPMATFFGEKIAGTRIVFLVDNSGGMNGGGLETLITELKKTIDRLTPKQQFYVIFYSDVAYPMFYPRSVFQFARSTKENKRRLEAWLETVELCTGNAVDEGLKAAITTRPDTVFLLTDGRVNTTRDGRKLAVFLDSRGRRFTIHTFGMGTSPTSQATQQLKEIAAANGGRFKQVEISEEMKAVARKKARPYHNKQPGAVWGKKVGSW